MLVDEFVPFCRRSGKIVKDLRFLADDTRDSTTMDLSLRQNLANFFRKR